MCILNIASAQGVALLYPNSSFNFEATPTPIDMLTKHHWANPYSYVPVSSNNRAELVLASWLTTPIHESLLRMHAYNNEHMHNHAHNFFYICTPIYVL